MSKFNQKNVAENKTVNLAGGEAFVKSPKLEFVSILLTSFVQDQYYRSAKDGLKRVKELMHGLSDKKFLAKAAIYARNEFGMRSISHVVAAEIAAIVKGEQWTKNFFDKVVRRPDDMLEILAYYYANYGKHEPNSMRKGFGQAIARFDEYQLAKYKKEGAEVSLIDLVNVIHPPHTPAIEKLIKGTLKSADTWEAKLSKAGQDAKDDDEKEELKTEAWADLIRSRKIGYFALLRNLRNILEQAPEVVPQALEMLMDEKLIKNSLVLPFRFLTAIEEIQKTNLMGAREVMSALNKALEISVSNVPKFEGKTLVALDISSSMQGKTKDIAALFGAILLKANPGADLIRFESDAAYMTVNPDDSLLTIARQISASTGGTDMGAVFDVANRAYDRVIFLSDEQGWVGYDVPTRERDNYRSRVGANPRIYSFNLSEYGTMQFPEPEVYALSGFSEKAFDVMKLLEKDRNALIHEIEKIVL